MIHYPWHQHPRQLRVDLFDPAGKVKKAVAKECASSIDRSIQRFHLILDTVLYPILFRERVAFELRPRNIQAAFQQVEKQAKGKVAQTLQFPPVCA